MSGKGSGKKRNRASQSEQHDYQEPHSKPVAGHSEGAAAGAHPESPSEKQRVLSRIRDMERQRRERQR
ncbi:MAG: hypothetical protein ACYC6B_01930 [Thermoleophilia bacterium]